MEEAGLASSSETVAREQGQRHDPGRHREAADLLEGPALDVPRVRADDEPEGEVRQPGAGGGEEGVGDERELALVLEPHPRGGDHGHEPDGGVDDAPADHRGDAPQGGGAVHVGPFPARRPVGPCTRRSWPPCGHLLASIRRTAPSGAGVRRTRRGRRLGRPEAVPDELIQAPRWGAASCRGSVSDRLCRWSYAGWRRSSGCARSSRPTLSSSRGPSEARRPTTPVPRRPRRP